MNNSVSDTSSEFVSSLNSEFSGVAEISSDSDLDVGVLVGEVEELLLAEVGLVSGKSDDEGDSELDELGGLDDAFSDQLAGEDTAEDVDEDGFDLGVGVENFEGSLDLVDVGTTTDVEEVSGGAAVELNDVHGAHGEASTVDKAADVAVESDVREAGLDRLFLVGIDVLTGNGSLTEFNEFLLSELGVVIDVDLRVDAEEVVLRIGGPRVDFDLGRVELVEHIVEILDLFLGVFRDVSELEFADDSVQVSIG